MHLGTLSLGLAFLFAMTTGCRTTTPDSSSVKSTETITSEARFTGYAKNLVWCFEQAGVLAAEYDETGDCDSYGSLWQHASKNPSIVPTLKSFVPADGGVGVGHYAGGVTFRRSSDATTCAFAMTVDYSGEDVLVKIQEPVVCSKRDFYLDIAKNLVWCFEQTHELQSEYDETGDCAGAGSLWQHSSTNPSITATVATFVPGLGGPNVGSYDGKVAFKQGEQNCQFAMAFVYSGEDIAVRITKPVACERAGG